MKHKPWSVVKVLPANSQRQAQIAIGEPLPLAAAILR
jgi:hypothetical protein